MRHADLSGDRVHAAALDDVPVTQVLPGAGKPSTSGAVRPELPHGLGGSGVDAGQVPASQF
jgi:hypothetical protein